MIPPLVVFGMFYIWPFLRAFYVSLFSWSGFSKDMTFVGLANFKKAFQDDIFWLALKHNLFFLVWCTLFTLVISLFFAVCFTRLRVRFKNFFRIIYFFPNTLSDFLLTRSCKLQRTMGSLSSFPEPQSLILPHSKLQFTLFITCLLPEYIWIVDTEFSPARLRCSCAEAWPGGLVRIQILVLQVWGRLNTSTARDSRWCWWFWTNHGPCLE